MILPVASSLEAQAPPPVSECTSPVRGLPSPAEGQWSEAESGRGRCRRSRRRAMSEIPKLQAVQAQRSREAQRIGKSANSPDPAGGTWSEAESGRERGLRTTSRKSLPNNLRNCNATSEFFHRPQRGQGANPQRSQVLAYQPPALTTVHRFASAEFKIRPTRSSSCPGLDTRSFCPPC